MIWGNKRKQECMGSVCQWFAWHPVRLRDGRWVWWETVWLHEWTTKAGDIGRHYEQIIKEYL